MWPRARPGLIAASALLASIALPARARAHVRLVSPLSRYGDEMKVGPCGRSLGTRTANVTTLRPGSTVTVTFLEIIDHPGYFRIAFDPAGDDDLGPPVYDSGTSTFVNPSNVQVLADHIADAVSTSGSVEVTLPSIECDTCTLQLIQVMTDKPPFDGLDDFYYQCADLVLSATLPVGGPPPPPSSPPPPAMSGGGCGSPSSGAPALLAALLALLALRRPRGVT
jgi:hypothetical protein